MKKSNLKKLTVTAILAAVAVVGSLFSFPVFGSKCAPAHKMFTRCCTGAHFQPNTGKENKLPTPPTAAKIAVTVNFFNVDFFIL